MFLLIFPIAYAHSVKDLPFFDFKRLGFSHNIHRFPNMYDIFLQFQYFIMALIKNYI